MDHGSLTFLAANIHFELIAVEKAKALVDVADTDAAAVHLAETFGRYANAVVRDFDGKPAAGQVSPDVNLAALEARRKAVLDRVFHHGLQQHARNERVQGLLVHFLEELKLIAAEANHFDAEIIVDEVQLFAKGHECLVLAKQAPQNLRQPQHDPASQVLVDPDQ